MSERKSTIELLTESRMDISHSRTQPSNQESTHRAHLIKTVLIGVHVLGLASAEDARADVREARTLHSHRHADHLLVWSEEWKGGVKEGKEGWCANGRARRRRGKRIAKEILNL